MYDRNLNLNYLPSMGKGPPVDGGAVDDSAKVDGVELRWFEEKSKFNFWAWACATEVAKIEETNEFLNAHMLIRIESWITTESNERDAKFPHLLPHTRISVTIRSVRSIWEARDRQISLS